MLRAYYGFGLFNDGKKGSRLKQCIDIALIQSALGAYWNETKKGQLAVALFLMCHYISISGETEPLSRSLR